MRWKEGHYFPDLICWINLFGCDAYANKNRKRFDEH